MLFLAIGTFIAKNALKGMFLFVMFSGEKSIKNFTSFYQAFSKIIDFSRTK